MIMDEERLNITADYGAKENSSMIKVIGVGGGGCNAVKHMYSEGIVGVDFLVCNTDGGHLKDSPIPNKLLLGNGCGAGSIPEKARQFATESRERIAEFIGKETQMLFITAGMGKGTGTGASPVVAEVAKEMGILTIGVVTTPFKFEGRPKAKIADKGIEEMAKHVDSLIIVQNQNILKYYQDLAITKAYGYADDVLKNAVKCIAELITVNYMQNVDFNDVKTIMTDSGKAMLGIAQASGENRVEKVVAEALNCPLLDTAVIKNAENFLFFISYGPDANFTTTELEDLTDKFYDYQSDDAHIIWGHGEDASLGDSIKLSVIITKFNTPAEDILTNGTGATIINENNDTTIYTTDQKIGNVVEEKVTIPTDVNNTTSEVTTAQSQINENLNVAAQPAPANEPAATIIDLNNLEIETMTVQQPTINKTESSNETLVSGPTRIEESKTSFNDDEEWQSVISQPAFIRQQTMQAASMKEAAVATSKMEYAYSDIYQTANDISEFFMDLPD